MHIAQAPLSLAYVQVVFTCGLCSPADSSLSQATSVSADQADGTSDYNHYFPLVISNYRSSSPRCWGGWRSGLGWIKADVNGKCKFASPSFMLKLWIGSLAGEFCPHALTHSCQCWKDCVVSLMGWTTSSLSFEADKPFKTMTNILLQFCQRKGKEMK